MWKNLITVVVPTVAMLDSSSVLADDDNAGEKLADGVWRYDIPRAVKSQVVRCKILDENLLCNGPIGGEKPARAADVVKPSNCGFTRRGKYICW